MPSPNYHVLCCPLPYRVAPVFVQVVSPPLGWWSPLSSFLVIQVVTREGHRLSLRRLICPAQDHLIFLTVFIISMTFVLSLTQMLVLLSLYVMLSMLFFHFGLCGRKFVLCLFGQCPGLCTIYHSRQHSGVVHLSLQADGKVAFEDITVFGVCRPACHESSLYLFVLVLFLEAVVLSQVHVALDFSISTLFKFIGVLSKTTTVVFAMFILRRIRLLSSDSSCSICCSYCGASVHRKMSSAKRRLERNSPSIFTPLFSQFNLLNMLSTMLP